jgi:AcrR family transcriptional regulator
MGARADAAEQTRQRILQAALELFLTRDPDEITLEAIAERAEITLQTVLRKFGSKDALFAAAAEHKSAEIVRSREAGRSGDPAAALRTLMASYEQMGELNWRLLRFEKHHPSFHTILVQARANHRAWLERAFEADLPPAGSEREHTLDALFSVTDFYLWKLHRLDLGRSEAETEAVLLGLVQAVLSSRRTP